MHGLLASQSCYHSVQISSLLRHPYILLISLEIFFITFIIIIAVVTNEYLNSGSKGVHVHPVHPPKSAPVILSVCMCWTKIMIILGNIQKILPQTFPSMRCSLIQPGLFPLRPNAFSCRRESSSVPRKLYSYSLSRSDRHAHQHQYSSMSVDTG